MIERRMQNNLDAAKFSTQRQVTYILLAIFAAVVVNVLLGEDKSERSMIIQTVVNLALLAVGYWLGASKAAADLGQATTRIAELAAPSTAAAVAASVAQAAAPMKADTVQVEGDNVTVKEK